MHKRRNNEDTSSTTLHRKHSTKRTQRNSLNLTLCKSRVPGFPASLLTSNLPTIFPTPQSKTGRRPTRLRAEAYSLSLSITYSPTNPPTLTTNRHIHKSITHIHRPSSLPIIPPLRRGIQPVPALLLRARSRRPDLVERSELVRGLRFRGWRFRGCGASGGGGVGRGLGFGWAGGSSYVTQWGELVRFGWLLFRFRVRFRMGFWPGRCRGFRVLPSRWGAAAGRLGLLLEVGYAVVDFLFVG